MKYFIFLFSFFSTTSVVGQSHMIYVADKNKPEPFLQKLSLVSDLGMANSFTISNLSEKGYKPEPKMNLGFEIECPRAYFELGYNFAEEAPEFKIGTFLIEEKLVMYLAFSRQLKPYEKEPEGIFVGGFESNFDLLKIFKQEESKESKFGFLVSPFVEIGTSSPDKVNLFNFGFIFKPKYHLFLRS